MGQLRLEVRDFQSPVQWRWLLTEESTGQALADHQVSLDPQAAEYKAFTDLYRYLRRNAVPDRRPASEAEIVAQVGTWAAREVLGTAIGSAIAAAAPVTVRVSLPEQAESVVSWPLELAHVGGGPLAARGDIALVYDVAHILPGIRDGAVGRAVGQSLRMLAVFSLPTETSVLALRRERYELTRLIRQIAAREGRLVELTVLQYGVTRERLERIADAGNGWDVMHLSGHGGRGEFLLEKPDGSPDPIDIADLMQLLAPLRRRLQLSVVSACESAATATAETLRWLGLEERAEQIEKQGASEREQAGAAVTGIAGALLSGLGCPVVAMRYPVADDFAVAFAGDLYERLLGTRDTMPSSQGQPLDIAYARAVKVAAGKKPSAARPAVSLATPVLIGARAIGLTLDVPRGRPLLETDRPRMERFPAEPERFVGRAQAMAQASAALAPRSAKTGVLLHGMAGSGKTACALELAYRHHDSFAVAAFWKAPENYDEFGAALASLGATLDVQLGDYGFTMSDKISTTDSLHAFTPRLQRVLEDSGMLLVLDNLETLLTPSGTWRDPRWEPLIAALAIHQGESRVILTSRIPPAGLGESVLVLPVHALDLAESAALARELPGMRGLLHADSGPVRDNDHAAVEADRNLVRRILRVVQGHPKLMELADAAAADRDKLTARLDAAERAVDGQTLDAFLRDGTTHLGADTFLDVLTTWTSTVLAALPEPARLMAQFLACIEDADRDSVIVDVTWANLWRRLAQPGEPPNPLTALATLTSAALIQPAAARQDTGEDRVPVFYRIHPGVVQAIRASSDPGIQAAADTELASFMRAAFYEARRRESGQAMVRAGLAAVPYLLRMHEWEIASHLLESALTRDRSASSVQAALPALRAIVAATHSPTHLGLLADVLGLVDQVGGEELARTVLTEAVADGNYREATATTDHLSGLLQRAGRLEEALSFADKTIAYASHAGLGKWGQLAGQIRRMEILALMGRHKQVLGEMPVLMAQVDELPAASDSGEVIEQWRMREIILGAGQTSALGLGEWQQALDLNAAIELSMKERGASPDEIVNHRFYTYSPLIRLGRFREADQLLIGCQQFFEENDNIDGLAGIFAARADLESTRTNLAGALAFQQTAIRFAYARPVPPTIAIHHYNLALHLINDGSDPAAQRAHRLAAGLIFSLVGMATDLDDVIRALARELRRDIDSENLPGTLDEVIRVAELTEGVHLGQLISALQPDIQAAADALTQMLRVATDTGPEQVLNDQLQSWEPIIALTVAAAGGDPAANAELMPILDELAQEQEWASLAAVLRSIADGEDDRSLLTGLDPIEKAIAAQVLNGLST